MPDRDRLQPKRPAEPDAQVVRNPAIEGRLTLKKQLQSNLLAAQRKLVAVKDELEALATLEKRAQDLYQEYADLNQQAQNAQAQIGAAKSGETRVSELRFRVLLGACFQVAFLILAAVQKTTSSMTLVMLLLVVPTLVYVYSKAKALRIALRSLPSQKGGDPKKLRKEADQAWKRYQTAATLVARKPSRQMLLADYQQAVQNVGHWEREAGAAEAKLQSLYSEARAKRRQDRPS